MPAQRERVAQVPADDAPELVRVARAGQQRGRADQHLVVNAAGEVDAEERQGGIGHGVDERAYEVAALGPQAQPGAAEGDDARVGVAAGRDREPVGPAAGAEDGEARAALALGVADADPAGRRRRPTRRRSR